MSFSSSYSSSLSESTLSLWLIAVPPPNMSTNYCSYGY
jgi:hypothetical protein